jgi:chloramphenicol 3-O phosphotransferase
MAPGTIIYLNGTSSSGKTSITHALSQQLNQPYLHCPIDLFEQMILHQQIHRSVVPDLQTLQAGFNATIAALANQGNNIIVDDVICEPLSYPGTQSPLTTRELLLQRIKALHMFDLLFVKVYCPLQIVEQREQARGNRTLGLASFQFHRVHQDSLYDVEVDTNQHTPDACAAQILMALGQTHSSRAFQTMATQFNL